MNISDLRTCRAWLYLLCAIVLEVAGSSLMKGSQQFSGAGPFIGYTVMLVCVAISYWLLALSSQTIPIGVTYACWEGLGLGLITLASVCFLDEPLTLTRGAALIAVFFGLLLIERGTVAGEKSV